MSKSNWVRMYPDDQEKSYVFPDPTSKRAIDAVDVARHGQKYITQDQGSALAEMADVYCHLLTHPAGTESAIKKLREMRRELKARAAEPEGGSDDE